MDEDINVSLTQTERLIQELSKGAKYPRINMLYGNYADFEEAVSFLEMLCRVFDWEKQEKKKLTGDSRRSDYSKNEM